MKPQELRIGNLVLYSDSEGEDYQETKVGFGDFSFMSDIEKNALRAYEYYKPIPLTYEWLEKFGFEELNNGTGYEKSNVKISNDFYWSIFGETAKQAEVKYVHQLQNLYFALTGSELPHP